MGFEGRGDFNRISWVCRRRVRDRHNRYHLTPFHHLSGSNNRGRTGFSDGLLSLPQRLFYVLLPKDTNSK